MVNDRLEFGYSFKCVNHLLFDLFPITGVVDIRYEAFVHININGRIYVAYHDGVVETFTSDGNAILFDFTCFASSFVVTAVRNGYSVMVVLKFQTTHKAFGQRIFDFSQTHFRSFFLSIYCLFQGY